MKDEPIRLYGGQDMRGTLRVFVGLLLVVLSPSSDRSAQSVMCTIAVLLILWALAHRGEFHED